MCLDVFPDTSVCSVCLSWSSWHIGSGSGFQVSISSQGHVRYSQHEYSIVVETNFVLVCYYYFLSDAQHDVANMIAFFFIGSRIDYCNSLLLGVSEQNLDRLQCVLNEATRTVCNASRHAPSSDLLHSLHWLPVCRRVEFSTPYSVSKQ